MKNIHILCIIAMILMGMASSAMAKTFVECGCDRFLAGGLFKTKKSITEQSHKNIFNQFLCSADEGLIQQVSKDKASLGFSVPGYVHDFDFQKSDDSSYLKEWRSNFCSDVERVRTSQSLFDSIRLIADDRIIEGANKCYRICQSGGLFCDLVRLDEKHLLFSANWTPPTNDVKFPKLTGGGIQGGRMSDVGTFGRRAIETGMDITISGVTANIEATNPAAPVSVQIDTNTAGSCSTDIAGLDISYEITVSLQGVGEVPNGVTQTQRHRIGNSGSCTEKNVNAAWPVCLPIGAKITYHTLGIHSIARGRAWAELGNPTPNCAMLRATYSDGGRRTFGDCRGNGWVDAELTVVGEVLKQQAIDPYTQTKSIEIPYGEGTQIVFQYPTHQIDRSRNIQWVYEVAVKEELFDRTIDVSLSNAGPNFDKFTTSVTPEGTLSLGILRAAH